MQMLVHIHMYRCRPGASKISVTAKNVFPAHFAHYKYFYLYNLCCMLSLVLSSLNEHLLLQCFHTYMAGHHLQASSSFRLESTSDSLYNLPSHAGLYKN